MPDPLSTDPCSGPALPLPAAADMQDALMTASNDLDRLQRLLGDASDALLGHFKGAAVELEQLLGARPGADTGALRDALRHVAGAITAMQFQDMASQLIQHTHTRLRHCADRLAAEAMGDDEDGGVVVRPAPPRPNPVTQDEMDAGSVELF